jgi:subtilisin family serine protease
MFHEVLISKIKQKPSNSYSDTYYPYKTSPELGDGCDNQDALISDLKNQYAQLGYDVYELGIDTLPENVPDIRGKVSYEPDRIFVVVVGQDDFHFFGVIET